MQGLGYVLDTTFISIHLLHRLRAVEMRHLPLDLELRVLALVALGRRRILRLLLDDLAVREVPPDGLLLLDH